MTGQGCVCVGEHDRWRYGEVLRVRPSLRALVERLPRHLRALALDLFAFLVKRRPAFTKGADWPLNRLYLEILWERTSFHDLRRKAIAPEVIALILQEILSAFLTRDEQNHEGGSPPSVGLEADLASKRGGEAVRAAGAGERALSATESDLANLRQKIKFADEWSAGEESLAALAARIEAETARARRIEAAVDEALSRGVDDLRGGADQAGRADLEYSIDAALEGAGREVRRLEELLRDLAQLAPRAGWGLEQGNPTALSWDELARLAAELRAHRAVIRIADLVGRKVPRKGRDGRRREPWIPGEVSGVTFGRDLRRLAPQERLALRHPVLRKAALLRLAEGRAAQLLVDAPEPVGRGPVVLIVDTSGSMNGPPIRLAKALALALALRCWDRRRPFVMLTFGGPGELNEVRFPVGARLDERLRVAARLAFNGGTDFDGPLERLVEIVSEREWSLADGVFVTDGECGVRRDTLALIERAKRRIDLELHGVLVGHGRGLEGIATRYHSLT